jgi:hypothetical protein
MRWLAALLIMTLPAYSHEIYGQFYSSGEPGVGRWCCNGNTEGTAGDCAPAEYTMQRDGSALMVSKRYPGKVIHVAAHRILWLSVPGGEEYDAHLCAVPRVQGGPPPNEDDIDSSFIVYCAAIKPFGS